MTPAEQANASEYLADMLSSDPHLTRRVAVDSLMDTFALTDAEAAQVWKDRTK